MKGYNVIGKEISALGKRTIQSFNPKLGKELDNSFHIAIDEEIQIALDKAKRSVNSFRAMDPGKRAAFLRSIADNIEALSGSLVDMVTLETGLPEARVIGERGRTCNQLRFFAKILDEGSWVNAILDSADPDRVPAKPDIRQMMLGLGPVVVFSASNFPLAFSTAGGDTASALAAGCPVIVKAHESHPGTNQLISEAIRAAAIETGMPDGVFSSLYAQGFETGRKLVMHPDIKAVAFTGSFSGGKALYDLAQSRNEPIPVFAEMGSVNPIVVFESAMENETIKWADAIAASVNLGAGQFCTNPGLIIVQQNPSLLAFKDQLVDSFSNLPSSTMLNPGIYKNYEQLKMERIRTIGVGIDYIQLDDDKETIQGHPCLLEVSGHRFLNHPDLAEEVFGPLSIVINCKDDTEVREVIQSLGGQLTMAFIGSEAELLNSQELLEYAIEKAGRIIFNGLPTGVEVCQGMQHGGPFPASTDSRFTSVGGNAIYRFVRPVSYQDFPNEILPEALKDGNPLKIHRIVDGVRAVH